MNDAIKLPERMPIDYALEFAEYMAKGAEALLESLNARDAYRLSIEDSGADVEPEDMQGHDEAVNDHLSGLRRDVHEFRKRRDRAARTALEGAAEQRWQTIETAPKDRTEVLLWRDDCGAFIGSYTSADAFPLTQKELDSFDEETLFAQDWFTQWPDARRVDGSETPTHWQALPPAPTTLKDTNHDC